MSKLGRRLVFVLLSLSLTLMGISLAVNATATDWRSQLKAQSEAKSVLNTRLGRLTEAIENEERELRVAEQLKDAQVKSYTIRISQVNAEIAKSRIGLEKTHKDYQASQEEFNRDLKEQERISQELVKLRNQIKSYEDQISAFDAQNQELTDMVSQLEREVQELERSRAFMEKKSN